MKITPIRLRRLNAGLDNIDNVIKILDISKSTFYKLEQGWTSPSPQLIKRMADTYKCTVDEVFHDLNIVG